MEIDPFDPYIIAKQRATSFEKYVIMSYIDNLIDWGDALYAKGSWEALNQATMLYIRAWDLLGNKLMKKGKRVITTQTFEELKKEQQSGNLSTAICKLEAKLPSTGEQQLKAEAQSIDEIYDMKKYGCYFCKPENKNFIDLWNRVEDRLYKIRNCLDVTGKRLELPLFQSPIDPNQLIQSYASAGSPVKIPSINQVPHYRFNYMLASARSIVETVIQFGSELLSVLEKRDAEEMNILYNKQEGIIANLITTIKEKAIESLKKESEGLNESLKSAHCRKSHYEKLIENGLSSLEKKAFELSKEAIEKRESSAIARGIAAATHLIPTVFGLANGCFQPGSATEIAAIVYDTYAMKLDGQASEVGTKASYERRAEDWKLQEVMATHDVEQIKHQIEANKINQLNAEQDLESHNESIKQIKEKGEFFRNKFTNQELYNWMKGQIVSIYFQIYKMALEVVLQVEKTYQYELNNNRAFITNSSWNNLREGLLAGNALKFILEQIAKSYNEENKRALEITKVTSLQKLDPLALYELKTKGECNFSLTEKLFDLDFPGHYCRKIKGIRITIPAVVGPYENVHATLQQTSNKIVLKPNIDAPKFLLGESSNRPANDILRENWQRNQEIAISRGDQDSGLFEFSFNDERYLPFEGTGAISDWKLELPTATNRFDLNSISDVIIHIDYIAFSDGGLAEKVKNLQTLKHYNGILVLNLSTTYNDIWKKFKQDQAKSLTLKPTIDIFPTYIKNPELDKKIYVIPKGTNQIKNIKVNGCSWDHSSYQINSDSDKIKIGEDWKLEIDSKQVDEIIVIIPYKAEINWVKA